MPFDTKLPHIARVYDYWLGGGNFAAGAAMMNQAMAGSITFRARAQVAAFFEGLELVEPGLVSTPQWRPGTGVTPRPLPGWVGVARKA